jgi:hypothetical protein
MKQVLILENVIGLIGWRGAQSLTGLASYTLSSQLFFKDESYV